LGLDFNTAIERIKVKLQCFVKRVAVDCSEHHSSNYFFSQSASKT
jgi:hypothetical protein